MFINKYLINFIFLMPAFGIANNRNCMKTYFDTSKKEVLKYLENQSQFKLDIKINGNYTSRQIKPGDVVLLIPHNDSSSMKTVKGLVHSVITDKNKIVGVYIRNHDTDNSYSENLNLLWLNDFSAGKSKILEVIDNNVLNPDLFVDIGRIKIPNTSGHFLLPFGKGSAPVSVGDILWVNNYVDPSFSGKTFDLVVTGFSYHPNGEVKEIIGNPIDDLYVGGEKVKYRLSEEIKIPLDSSGNQVLLFHNSLGPVVTKFWAVENQSRLYVPRDQTIAGNIPRSPIRYKSRPKPSSTPSSSPSSQGRNMIEPTKLYEVPNNELSDDSLSRN